MGLCLAELLRQLLTAELGGKFVVGDQCAYGKMDFDSGRPIRKSTGWLSNNKPILNAVGKRCKCRSGSHEQVVGANSRGPRSRQAAAYPKDLCKAICEGILHSMVLDYAAKVPQELSYPTYEEQEDDTLMQDLIDIGDDSTQDHWEVQPDKIIRVHKFSPMSVDDLPCDFNRLLPFRHTSMKFEDGTENVHVDEWTSPDDPFRRSDLTWVGHTEIGLTPVPVDEDAAPSAF